MRVKNIKTLDDLRKDAEQNYIPWNKVVAQAGFSPANAYKMRNPREDTLVKLTRALNLIKAERGNK